MKKEQNGTIEEHREECIRVLAYSSNQEETLKKIANNLFELDLTVYSKDYTLDSLVYNALSSSILDEKISLHPEQLRILEKMVENDAVILSAPTSFGKTYCVFEYIAQYMPDIVVLIVPTLALINEYIKKIIKKYDKLYEQYKVYTQVKDNIIKQDNKKIMYILTHDRVLNEDFYNKINEVDLLVIDEVYKLAVDKNDDRTLVLNMAYYHLAQKSKKYILLAPFINGIVNIEKLDKKPEFVHSNYSPVVNDVIIQEIESKNNYLEKAEEILDKIPINEKTLIYFATVVDIKKYVNTILEGRPKKECVNDEILNFLKWAKTEIHENWSVVKALEKGYLIHNGQIPLGVRNFLLDVYENNQEYNRLLCTSTLLEGVNTTSENIIITRPSRSSNNAFTDFDFYNLVGRTGRLNNHLIGKAYYIKTKDDKEYKKSNAINKIQFEITLDSVDINIQKGQYENNEDYKLFLKELNINHSQYIENIGAKHRFSTVKKLYYDFQKMKIEVLEELKLIKFQKKSRSNLLLLILKIIGETNPHWYATIINKLLIFDRPSIKSIVDDEIKFCESKGKKIDIDNFISTTIKIKTSFIEHEFYSKVQIIKYFLSLDIENEELLKGIDDKILKIIDSLYFTSSKQKKMMVDLGIYDKDIDYIINIIGDDFDDAKELKQRLKKHISKFKIISFISKYVINNL